MANTNDTNNARGAGSSWLPRRNGKRQSKQSAKLQQLAEFYSQQSAELPLAPKVPEVAPSTQPLSALMSPEVLKQFIGFNVGPLAEGETGKSTHYYLFKDGFYKGSTLSMGRILTQVAKWDDPALPARPSSYKIGFSLTLPKIPFSVLAEIVCFFKEIHRLHGSEAYASVFWNGTSYLTHVPVQVVSGASVRHQQMIDNPGEIEVLQVHSHSSMSAFFSGTDDADEIAHGQRCYGVIGKLDQVIPEHKWRVRANQQFADISLADLFEFPDFTLTHTVNGSDLMQASKSGAVLVQVAASWDPFKGVSFPIEWLAQVSKPAPVLTTQSIGSGNYLNMIDNLRSQGKAEPAVSGAYTPSWWEQEARAHLKDEIDQDLMQRVYGPDYASKFSVE